VVERLLAKEKVVGSNPIARSDVEPRLSAVVGGRTGFSFCTGAVTAPIPGCPNPDKLRKTFIFFQIYVIMELRARERMC
jgi:hypothetical protein